MTEEYPFSLPEFDQDATELRSNGVSSEQEIVKTRIQSGIQIAEREIRTFDES